MSLKAYRVAAPEGVTIIDVYYESGDRLILSDAQAKYLLLNRTIVPDSSDFIPPSPYPEAPVPVTETNTRIEATVSGREQSFTIEDLINLFPRLRPAPGAKGEKGEKGERGQTGEQGPSVTINGKDGASITLTKEDIGLTKVQDIAPSEMPVSIAQARAIQEAIDNLLNNQDSETAVGIETLRAIVSQKASSIVVDGHLSNKSNPHGVTKEQIGLGKVADLSPAELPISTAAAAALAQKASAAVVSAHTGNTANPHGVTKDQVGLDKVANLAPDDLPLSKAAITRFAGKADFGDLDTISAEWLGLVPGADVTQRILKAISDGDLTKPIRGTPGAMYRLARGIVFPENSGFVSQGGGFNVSAVDFNNSVRNNFNATNGFVISLANRGKFDAKIIGDFASRRDRVAAAILVRGKPGQYIDDPVVQAHIEGFSDGQYVTVDSCRRGRFDIRTFNNYVDVSGTGQGSASYQGTGLAIDGDRTAPAFDSSGKPSGYSEGLIYRFTGGEIYAHPDLVAAYHYQTDGVNDGGSIGSRGYINAWRVHEGFDCFAKQGIFEVYGNETFGPALKLTHGARDNTFIGSSRNPGMMGIVLGASTNPNSDVRDNVIRFKVSGVGAFKSYVDPKSKQTFTIPWGAFPAAVIDDASYKSDGTGGAKSQVIRNTLDLDVSDSALAEGLIGSFGSGTGNTVILRHDGSNPIPIRYGSMNPNTVFDVTGPSGRAIQYGASIGRVIGLDLRNPINPTQSSTGAQVALRLTPNSTTWQSGGSVGRSVDVGAANTDGGYGVAGFLASAAGDEPVIRWLWDNTSFRPAQDNAYSLGTAGLRVSSVYAATSTTGTDSRFVSVDAGGRTTWNYPDNALTPLNVFINGGITAVGHGVSWQVQLGAPSRATSLAGQFELQATSTYLSTATQSSRWILRAQAAGTLSAVLALDPVAGNMSYQDWKPAVDNARSLGSASLRWSQLYAGTGTISTSDAREKTDVAALSAAEVAAACDLAREIGSFRFLDAIELKGNEARIHIGMTVQRAIEILSDHGLDPFAYAFVCRDEWPADPGLPEIREDVLDEDGHPTGETRIVQEARPPHQGGDRLGFRADQLALFLARGHEARLAALEARLAAAGP
ncbi:tail fiber domain-containing protein [uncultured Methylobacterium sp.]|jgi:hypothetical protein|uniref:tail fiber domain-containing protein n=1 Tax=uncultured Methylobacterium sp. TaxID=157278 RepID=UPI002614225F|nr:tail fiber domain-containing protein [uncultured Methylobacterium sp.]